MHCPFCENENTSVLDTRTLKRGHRRRRRECKACGKKFVTNEMVSEIMPKVIKKDKSWESFSEEKLRSGLELAMQKRPVDISLIDKTVEQVMQNFRNRGQDRVNSSDIADSVMHHLGNIDEVAYVRFAAEYLTLDEVKNFGTFSKKRSKGEKKPPPLPKNQLPLPFPVDDDETDDS